MHRSAGQLGDVGSRADVIRMEVGDEDAHDLDAVQLSSPPLGHVGEADTGVDERPAVGAGQQVGVDVPRAGRQRARDAANAAREVHPEHLTRSP